MDGEADAWFDRELADCMFADERLGKRLRRLVEQMEGAMGASIPLACQDWANKDPTASHAGTLSSYLVKIARLGGYLARASDPTPGNTVMWRGLTRLTDIKLGATIGAELMGN